MTSHLRYARAARITALLLTAGAGYLLHRGTWLGALALVYVAALAVWIGGREMSHHRRARFEAARAERAARPGPCCEVWQHSRGRAHGPGCSRPPAARHDARLTEAERAAFQQITAHYDDRTTA